MPELPEVETIRRSLRFLEGRRIRAVRLSRLAPVEKSPRRAIRGSLEESALLSIGRRGKYLLLSTERGAVVLHLGMTGQLLFFPSEQAPRAPHTHLECTFQDGSQLRYIDPRRFGTLSFSASSRGEDNPFLQKLGPDYDDPTLLEEEFLRRCRAHPGLSLKALALHQGVAAGLGNIYACEALYGAELDPRRKVKRTKDERLVRLLHQARRVLQLGIAKGGSSLRDYFDGLGNRGIMREFLQVYDREDMATLDGRGTVRRIVQNARSTWFSPEIQK
jgi:formamidopyrimidine-DNA glycosylase